MELTFFTQAAALAALTVVAVEQILKLKFIPWQFANKYPVPTNIILSIGASIVVVMMNLAQPIDFGGWVLLVATIAVVAGIVYNTILRNWSELRAMEG